MPYPQTKTRLLYLCIFHSAAQVRDSNNGHPRNRLFFFFFMQSGLKRMLLIRVRHGLIANGMKQNSQYGGCRPRRPRSRYKWTLYPDQSLQGSDEGKHLLRGLRHRPRCLRTVSGKVFTENSGWFTRSDTAASQSSKYILTGTYKTTGTCQKPLLSVINQPSEEKQVPQIKQTHFNHHPHFPCPKISDFQKLNEKGLL